MGHFRIELAFKKKEFDNVSKGIFRQVKEDLQIVSVKKTLFLEFFELDLDEPEQKVLEIAGKVFVDPITQKYSLNKPLEKTHDFAVEVRLLPTITDNVALTARKAVEDFLNRKFSENESIRYGRLYLFYGKPTAQEIQSICTELLSNPQVEEFRVMQNA